MSLFDDASLIVTPNGFKAGKLYSIKPDTGAGDLDVTRATGATRVNENGLIEVVGNNVPRIDYPIGGGCPSILVEPQRTNLVLRSEEFDVSPWSLTGTTLTPNAIASPDGLNNGFKLAENTANSRHRVLQTGISIVSGTTYSISIFVKASERNSFIIRSVNATSDNTSVLFNLQNETATPFGAGILGKIEKYPNGWYKCILTQTASVTTTNFVLNLDNGTYNGQTDHSYQGVDGNGIFIWGAQLEAGSTATSYIPTTSAAVTRNGDVISKSGISSLIGQTEGTIYVEVDVKNIMIGFLFDVSDNTNQNRIGVLQLATGALRFVRASATQSEATSFTTSVIPLGINKLAISYKSGDTNIYLNGVKITTILSTFTFASLNKIDFGREFSGGNHFNNKINVLSVFSTILTEQQAIQLTTL